MLGVGDRIPEAAVWTAPRERATIEELVRERPLLLLFYLFDWSSTWTDEVGLLRDRRDEFDALGVGVVAASRDSPYSHVAWSEVLELNFPLLSDWNGEAISGFGVELEDYRGFRGVAQRSAFLIDSGGTVRGAWRYATDEVPDVDELLSAARALSD